LKTTAKIFEASSFYNRWKERQPTQQETVLLNKPDTPKGGGGVQRFFPPAKAHHLQ
jgi:hypothetical protein